MFDITRVFECLIFHLICLRNLISLINAEGRIKMKQIFFTLLMAVPLISVAKMSIIYGEDNRIDLYEIKDMRVKALGKSIAARIPNSSMREVTGNTYSIFNIIISDEWGPNVCTDQRFANQPSASDCSGFLVGEDLLVTAGHCVLDQGQEVITPSKTSGCQNNSWLFDYKVDAPGKLGLDFDIVPKSLVFHCSEVIRGAYLEDDDYALIRLSKKTQGRAALKLNMKRPVKVNQDIFVMGYPSGLPLKHAGGARVFSTHKHYFSTNLDTFGGNSGSPVFNEQTLEVEGILVRGDLDYVEREQGDVACQEVNRCDDNRNNCKDSIPDIDGEHVSHISRLKAVLTKN